MELRHGVELCSDPVPPAAVLRDMEAVKDPDPGDTISLASMGKRSAPSESVTNTSSSTNTGAAVDAAEDAPNMGWEWRYFVPSAMLADAEALLAIGCRVITCPP
jgi:hypothetical protein